MFKKFVLIVVVVAVVLAAVVAGSIYVAATKWRSPAAAAVDILPGMTVRAIAAELEKNGVIRTPKLFELYARAKRVSGKLGAGTYDFPAGTTMIAAIEKIARGEVRQYPFTVIEGWTIKDIVGALANQSFLANANVPAEVDRLARNSTFVGGLGLEGAQTLEGYLFPDTYNFIRPLTAEAFIKKLVGRFKEVWGSLGAAAGAASNMSQKDVVTLASIVEKETGAAEERPVIASVFFNRLKINMPLQSDPTIIYGLPDYDGNIRKSDITNPHPYNTYVHPGLPPGPICNPGKASLEAVLHPAQSDYLYFVSRNNGTHLFTKTLADHLAAVQKYQVEGVGRE